MMLGLKKHKKTSVKISQKFQSEASGIRTPDNLIKSQVLYRLSYTPLLNYLNAQSRNRTNDTRIFSPLLYQLSYLGFFLMPKA